MQYILLIYQTERWADVPVDEKNQIHAACGEWHDELMRSGRSKGAVGLMDKSTAKTLRVSEDRMIVSDGPFAETKEVLGGLEMVECRDLDEALVIARAFPALKSGYCTVEIRPGVGDGGCQD